MRYFKWNQVIELCDFKAREDRNLNDNNDTEVEKKSNDNQLARQIKVDAHFNKHLDGIYEIDHYDDLHPHNRGGAMKSLQ